jgi:hypothetical protein
MDIKELLGSDWKDDLTVEEIIELMSKVEPPKETITVPDNAEAMKWKASFDKASSELAAVKKQLNARLSEDEQKEAERASKEQAMQEQLDALKRDKTLSDTKSKYIALGYEEKLAEDTAKAFADGDMDLVFKNQKIHLVAVEKAAAEKALDDTPPPHGGQKGKQTVTKEQFANMEYAEELKFATENPEAYAELMKGE